MNNSHDVPVPGRRPVRRTVTILALVAGAVLASGGAASAHVTVSGPDAKQGSYAALTFRVPTERDNADTTKVVVLLPTDKPLASVSVKPHPGWTYQVTKSKLTTPLVDDDGNKTTEAVSQITWTATGPATAIKPGEYDEFSISGGPLPEADSITFRAIQTYSDSQQVKWIEPAASGGGAEPDHPAPTLNLAPASEGTSPSPSTSASPTLQAATSSTDDSSDSSATAALWIAVIALVVGVAAGALALRRRPSAT